MGSQWAAMFYYYYYYYYFLLTSQNRQGFPSFWIQKIGMKTNQTWQFVYNFRALSESQAGSKNGCWYIYIYVYIYRFLQNVRFWRVHQAQVPGGKGGIGRYRLLPCTFFFWIKKMIWHGLRKKVFLCRCQVMEGQVAVRIKVGVQDRSWWKMYDGTQEGIMEIKHLVFGWTSFSSNSNKVGSPYTNISYANICNKKPTKYMKYTHFLFWGPQVYCVLPVLPQWVACSSHSIYGFPTARPRPRLLMAKNSWSLTAIGGLIWMHFWWFFATAKVGAEIHVT